MAFGTLQHDLDTLKANEQTILQYGEDKAFANLVALFDAHETNVNEMLANIGIARTTERVLGSGGTDQMTSEEVDEWGTPDAQKIGAGDFMGFPLRRFGMALQWNRAFMAQASVRRLAIQIEGILDADIQRIAYQTKKALFTGTNYNFNDKFVDRLQQISLPIKALANGDGFPIPVSPSGVAFDASTHKHYLARAGAAFVEDDLAALVDTLVEHASTGEVFLYINRAEESTIADDKTNFPSFRGYPDPRVQLGANTEYAKGKTLDTIRLYNRAIGVFKGAEVWVKPWVPAGYIVGIMKGTGQGAPLVWRDPVQYPAGLNLEFDNEEHPIRAKGWFRFFDIAAYNRVGAAVLDTTHQTTYQAPTLTL